MTLIGNAVSPSNMYNKVVGGDPPLPIQTNFLGDWNMDNVVSAVNVQLEDSSGEGNHVLWEGSANNATLIPDTLNGHTVLDMPTVNDFWGFLSPNLASQHTIFFVVKSTSFAANRAFYSGNVGSTVSEFRTTGAPAFNSRWGSGQTYAAIVPSLAWRVIAHRRILGSPSSLWDETFTKEDTGASNGNNVTTGFRICADRAGANDFVGQMARVICYQTNLTDLQVTDTISVLKTIYGL